MATLDCSAGKATAVCLGDEQHQRVKAGHILGVVHSSCDEKEGKISRSFAVKETSGVE